VGQDEHKPGKAAVRLDKWLWAARCFKTRSKATAACERADVQVDGRAAKASQRVRPGMRVQVQTPGGLRILEVVALAERRASATIAQTLFVDHSPPPPDRDPVQRIGESAPVFLRKQGAGRPTKRDRRRLARERGDD